MTPTEQTDALRVLLDKQEVYELLARYLRAVDRGDVEGLRSCYTPDATEDHGGIFSGTAVDYIDSIASTLVHPRALSMHGLSNVLVDVDADRARAESYVTAFARVRTPGGPGDTLTAARMIDDLERVDGTWAIRHRHLVWEWNHDMDVAEGWAFGTLVHDPARLLRGGKHPHDPVYGVRA